MKTTLTLDDDIADKTRALASKLGKPLKSVANEALRLGLESVEKPARARRYRMKPHAMGLRAGYNINCTSALLAQLDGEDYNGFRRLSG